MLIGTPVPALLVIRFMIQLAMKNPERATAGQPVLDNIGVLTHYALYRFTFTMARSGLVMSLQRGYFTKLFGIGTIPLDLQPSQLHLGDDPRVELVVPGGLYPPAHWRGLVSPVHPQGPPARPHVGGPSQLVTPAHHLLLTFSSQYFPLSRGKYWLKISILAWSLVLLNSVTLKYIFYVIG